MQQGRERGQGWGGDTAEPGTTPSSHSVFPASSDKTEHLAKQQVKKEFKGPMSIFSDQVVKGEFVAS